jgi:hypothetical protein
LAAPNFVCTICSQTFTRRWRGSEHNNTLHAGLGKTVRLIDYMIGRNTGDYLPSDPALYRRRRKTTGSNEHKLPSLDKNLRQESYFHSSNPNTASDRGQDRLNPPSSKPASNPIQQYNEAIVKLGEIRRITSKYLSANQIWELLSQAWKDYIRTGDISSLDVTLDEVRKCIEPYEAREDLLNKP